MALQKEIELENGIIVNYHRIVSINKITNKSIMIEVGSYISEAKRQEEQEYYASQQKDKTLNVFIDTTYISKAYDENETIEDTYNYLKTTEKFKDSVDL